MAQLLKIAIQGGPASFHDIAARQYFSLNTTEMLFCPTFRRTCEALHNGEADFAMMAIENSLAGTILTNYNLLHQFGLHIVGETWLPIEQNLMALPGQDLQDIKEVFSHPVAIAQCGQFFRLHPHLQPQDSHDTADSAKKIQEKAIRGVGAIASRQAAELYGLQILAENIADRKDNFTRLLALSKQPTVHPQGNKASLLLELPQLNGSLGAVFNKLHSHEVHVSLVQSVPVPSNRLGHGMVVDLTATDKIKLKETIAGLHSLVQHMQVLGIYPGAIHPLHESYNQN